MSEKEISEEQLMEMIKSNKKLYYPYPELNDILYLHYKCKIDQLTIDSFEHLSRPEIIQQSEDSIFRRKLTNKD